jgi:hypothetical protein
MNYRNIILVFSFFQALQLNAQCPFNPTVLNGNVSLCPLQADTLSTEPANSYQWYKNGNPIIGANQQTLIINQLQDAGASFLVVSTINNCSEPSPAVQVININVPSIGFQVVNSPDNTACLGDGIELNVSEPFNTNLKWYRNGIQIQGQNSNSLIALATGSYSVSGSISQCPNTLRISSSTALTFINGPTPVISLDNLVPSLSTPNIAGQFQWYLNNSIIQDATQDTLLLTQNGNYFVEAIYSQGCIKQSSVFSFNGIFVDCPFNPTINPNNLILCPGSIDTLQSIQGDAFQWYKDEVLIQGAIQQQLLVDYFNSVGSNFTVDVTISGCTERSNQVLVDGWIFLPITVNTLTDLPLNNLCQGDTVILQVNPPYTNNIVWKRNNSIIPGANNDSLFVTNTGIYTVTGFTETCPNYFNESVLIDFDFKSAPVPTILFEQNSNTVSSSLEASNYNWFVNGSLANQLNTISFVATESAEYQLNVEYQNGCFASSLPLQITITGTEKIELENINIYPNPFGNFIQINNKSNANIQVEILTTDGKKVTSIRLSNNYIINTEDFKSGFYFLKVSYENGKVLTYKFIK